MTLMYLLITSMVILFILFIWISWCQGLRGTVLWFLIPFVLFNLGFSWHTLSELRGWPYHATPVADAQMLSAHVQKPWIYFVVQQVNQEPRLYAVPHTPERAKQAHQAQQRAAQGHQIMIMKKPTAESDDFILYEFHHLQQYQKD